VMDAVNSIHSVALDEEQITSCQEQLAKYHEKYKKKLKGKNVMYVKQLMYVINLFAQYFSGPSASCMLSVNTFVDALKIDHINIFKLQNFIKESKIANKLLGFAESARKKEWKSQGNSAKTYTPSHDQPLRVIDQFFSALSHPDKDGRVLVSKKPGIFC
jgi:chromosome transmission fidelity protein 1